MLNKFIIFNLITRLWSSLSNFIFVPAYIGIIGINGFAIIALGSLVAGVIAIFDLGMSSAIQREMARTDITERQRYAAFITLRNIYAFIVFALCLISPIASQFISYDYIVNSPIDRRIIFICVTIIILEAAIQIKLRFLLSTLMGKNLQIEANIFNLSWSIARNGFVIVPLIIFNDLFVFFVWQISITIIFMLIVLIYINKISFKENKLKFDWIDLEAFKRIRKFTAGVFFISLVAAINTQLDRIMIGRSLDVVNLGYYNLAVAIGAGILVLPSALIASVQPRLTGYFSDGKRIEAAHLYMHIATLTAALVFPLIAVIALNPFVVMLAWTGSPSIATQTVTVVPIIVSAYGLLAMASLAYGVALANGNTYYNNAIGLLTLFFSIPSYWISVKEYGLWGAAVTFFCLQSFATLVYHFLIDRRYISFGPWRSFMRLYTVPGVVAVSVAWLLTNNFADIAITRVGQLVYLAFCWMATTAVTLAISIIFFRLKISLD